MTDTNSNDFDVSDAALERAGVFGYDQNGYKHSFDPGRAQVIVQDGDDVIHVEQLARARVIEWIEFVATEKSGWLDQWFTVSDAGEAMQRRRVAEAQAADQQYEQAKQEASA